MNEYISVESVIEDLFNKDDQFPSIEGFSELDDMTAEELAFNNGRLLGEVEQLQLGLRVAEEYVWNDDSLSTEGFKDAWNSFWEWIGNIFVTIYEAVRDFFKRIFNWVTGKGKKELEDSDKMEKEISKDSDAMDKEIEVSDKAKKQSEYQDEMNGILDEEEKLLQQINSALNDSSSGKDVASKLEDLMKKSDELNKKEKELQNKIDNTTFKKVKTKVSSVIHKVLPNSSKLKSDLDRAMKKGKKLSNDIKNASKTAKKVSKNKTLNKESAVVAKKLAKLSSSLISSYNNTCMKVSKMAAGAVSYKKKVLSKIFGSKKSNSNEPAATPA